MRAAEAVMPYERQLDPQTSRMCGAACLSMVYRSFGKEVPQVEIWPAIAKPTASGSLASTTHLMALDAVNRGFSAVAIQARHPLQALRLCREWGIQAILNHRLRREAPAGHYSVLVDLNDKTVVLHDPFYGPSRRLSHAELLELWQPHFTNSEIVGSVVIGIAAGPPPALTCEFCHTPIPSKIACPKCKKPVGLLPGALLGCMRDGCIARMWNYVCCPSCDCMWTFSLHGPQAGALTSENGSSPSPVVPPAASGSEDPWKLDRLFGEVDKFCGHALVLAAAFEARPAADAIRKAIGEMTVDGTFAEIEARWGSLSGRNLELADSLIRSRRRERWLIAGISVAVLLLFLTSWQAVRIRRERSRSEHATTQLRQFAASLQNVRDEERTRIARELHDELGQALTAIKMDIGWAADRVPPRDKTFVDRFQSTLALIDTTIRNVRKVATELRPSTLDLGLNAAIEWLVEELHSRTGVAYSLDLPNPEVEADPHLSTTIFRILQEALTNVARHSRATRIDVRLERNHGDLILEVHDNGKGIPQQSPPDREGCLGILGMRERALALGGEVTVTSPASGGTIVRARIPFPAF